MAAKAAEENEQKKNEKGERDFDSDFHGLKKRGNTHYRFAIQFGEQEQQS